MEVVRNLNLEQNGQNAKQVLTVERAVISKETAKRHAKGQDPSRQQGKINGRTTNHQHKSPC